MSAEDSMVIGSWKGLGKEKTHLPIEMPLCYYMKPFKP